MSGGLEILQIDAFADGPFTGNPAAVLELPGWPSDEWLAAFAAEMNLSETAFVVREPAGWRLRWFTPAAEVDLCGHATLATAHALWERGRHAADAPIVFATRSGPLEATRRDDWIELDFPALRPQPVPAPEGLAAALRVDPGWVGRSRFDVLVEVPTAADVRACRPDIGALERVEARGVILTAPGDGGYDVVSRFFAPRVGVAEDPVTGSAHCVLGPFWAERLGRAELRCFQASRRGGAVRVRVEGDRVRLGGRALTVFRGRLAIPSPDVTLL